jgi:hypothetical protein
MKGYGTGVGEVSSIGRLGSLDMSATRSLSVDKRTTTSFSAYRPERILGRSSVTFRPSLGRPWSGLLERRLLDQAV